MRRVCTLRHVQVACTGCGDATAMVLEPYTPGAHNHELLVRPLLQTHEHDTHPRPSLLFLFLLFPDVLSTVLLWLPVLSLLAIPSPTPLTTPHNPSRPRSYRTRLEVC